MLSLLYSFYVIENIIAIDAIQSIIAIGAYLRMKWIKGVYIYVWANMAKKFIYICMYFYMISHSYGMIMVWWYHNGI